MNACTPPTLSRVDAQIRNVLREYAHLNQDPLTLDESYDLNMASMTPHDQAMVMLALEDAFDLDFPDHCFSKRVFANIAAIRCTVNQLLSA